MRRRWSPSQGIQTGLCSKQFPCEKDELCGTEITRLGGDSSVETGKGVVWWTGEESYIASDVQWGMDYSFASPLKRHGYVLGGVPGQPPFAVRFDAMGSNLLFLRFIKEDMYQRPTLFFNSSPNFLIFYTHYDTVSKIFSTQNIYRFISVLKNCNGFPYFRPQLLHRPAMFQIISELLSLILSLIQ